MKKKVLVAVLSLVCFLSYGDLDEVPHILVYGTAETMAVPDELIWSLSVKTMGADINNVASNHVREVSAVLGFLKTKSEETDLKTSQMQLNENWVYRNRNRVKEGFYASTKVVFKSLNFADYQSCWIKLSGFENLTINNVGFGVSDRIAVQNATRLKAVRAAKQKAVALAAAMEVTLYEPLVIEEIYGSAPDLRTVNSVAFGESDGLAEGVISPGTESVKVQIKVMFRIGSEQ